MRRVKRVFTPIVLALGTATFLYLLWTFGPARVWGQLRAFGWGFALLLPFQILDHMLNAYAWRLAFPPAAAGRADFWDLVRIRIAGDGVNYLTPSGNIAGEFVRPGMLRCDLPSEVKIASVFLAKVTQAVGQAFFVILGLGYILMGRLYVFHGGQAAVGAAAMLAILAAVAFGVWVFASEPPEWVRRRIPEAVEKGAPVRVLLRHSLARHPVRLAGSTLFFMLGYGWGACEIWLIARLMGMPLNWETCLSIEFLSNLVDAMAFMVPAKIGTQEGGKAVIFKGLGLAPHLGFTLGIIRHVREVCWAGLGLAFYASHQKRHAS